MRALHAFLAVALVACERTPIPRPEPEPAASAATAVARRPPGVVTFRQAPPGAVDELVRREQAEARAQGQRLLVYVGATWCEPCQRFHHAADEGRLEGKMPPLRLLEFDLDQDGDRLRAAGYRSRLIPLFALPGDDGRASGQQIEGGIKGDGAVDELTGRLRKLVGAGP